MRSIYLLMCMTLVSSCQSSNPVVPPEGICQVHWDEQAREVVSGVVEGSATNVLSTLRDMIPAKARRQDVDRVFSGFKQQPHIDVASGVGLAEYRSGFYRISYTCCGHVFTVDYLAAGEDEGNDVYCGLVEYHHRRSSAEKDP